MTKDVWVKGDVQLIRVNTTYNLTVHDEQSTAATDISRGDLLEMFLAMKKELGLAGD